MNTPFMYNMCGQDRHLARTLLVHLPMRMHRHQLYSNLDRLPHACNLERETMSAYACWEQAACA